MLTASKSSLEHIHKHVLRFVTIIWRPGLDCDKVRVLLHLEPENDMTIIAKLS